MNYSTNESNTSGLHSVSTKLQIEFLNQVPRITDNMDLQPEILVCTFQNLDISKTCSLKTANFFFFLSKELLFFLIFNLSENGSLAQNIPVFLPCILSISKIMAVMVTLQRISYFQQFKVFYVFCMKSWFSNVQCSNWLIWVYGYESIFYK